MPPSEPTPTRSGPLIVPPDAGPRFDAAGDRYRIIAGKADTGGRYGLFESVVPPGGGPPPHVHTREDEGFYILEGEIAFYAEGRRVVAGAGTFINLPSDRQHRFANESDRPARMLIVVAPGGMEGFFAKVGVPVADPSAPHTPMDAVQGAAMMAAAPEFGLVIAPPPDAH